MSSLNHHNHEYDGGSPNIPEDTGDRYYAQDLGRDFQYHQERLGMLLKDLSIAIPAIANGLVASHIGGTDTLSITTGAGYVEFDVTIPGDAGSGIPPSTGTGTIEAIRVQVDIAIGGYDYSSSATLDGATPNYIKLRYAEKTVYSRNRAKKAGSYNYEQEPYYALVIDAVAPTTKDIVVESFTSNPSGAGFAFTGTRSPQLYVKGECPIGTIISVDPRALVAPNSTYWKPCITAGAALPAQWFNVGTYPNVPVLDDSRFLMGAAGGYAVGGSNAITTDNGNLGTISWAAHTHDHGTLFACIFVNEEGATDTLYYKEVSVPTPPTTWSSTHSGSSLTKNAVALPWGTGTDVLGDTGSGGGGSQSGNHTHVLGTAGDTRPQYFTVDYYIRVA